MPVTPTDIDAAVPVAGTPDRTLTNAVLKGLITDIADVGVGVGIGTVNTFADLPAPATVSGQRWWVRTSTGVWLVNRQVKGAYYSNGATWSYLGDFPVSAVEVGFTPGSGIAAVNTQAAIEEVVSDTATLLAGKAGTATFTSVANGLVPASGGGTTNFLRADGTFVAPPGGSADPITLANAPATSPSAATISVGESNLAGLPVLSVANSSLWTAQFQPISGRSRLIGYIAGPSTTTLDRLPGAPAALTVTGTGTARAIASTNFYTRQPRVGYISVATAGSISGVHHNSTSLRSFGMGGSNLGGFLYIGRFGCSDAATVAGARQFVGVIASAAVLANVEPNTLTDCIGVAQLSTSTNLHIVYGGSVAQTAIDLGSSFPANTLSTDLYELILFSSPNDNTVVGYEVTRLNTGDKATGTLTNTTPGTTLPATSTLLGFRAWRTNNATALAVGLDIASLVVHTHY